ncbi:phytanoyl- dioxygenase family protein [Fusarium langsethiae]|uniref:Phytanoyl-dioxygenase family protein n=1 Tax=Fusarium langsethiae TaxID=179993 RepID=A0A0M9EVL3_FUSLA|nr:phytanoyl- dioxygenase family protein [Fusarium langsethiae]GKU03969.1 unnamed protein product [Fusarium langsethiae]GKU19780.1 unnamed protein product [Fusarium langsethiae]
MNKPSLIRRWSLKFGRENPKNELAQAVGKHTQSHLALEVAEENEDKEWEQWFLHGSSQGFEDTKTLQKQTDELKAALDEFQKSIPEAKRSPLTTRRLPTIFTARATAQSVLEEWEAKKETKYGKAKENLIKFCQTLDAYKAIFSVIPDGDMYTGLLTGAVSCIVQAFARHNQLAEGFSQALVDIGVDLQFIIKQCTIQNKEEIRPHSLDFATEYFKFLTYTPAFYNDEIQTKVGNMKRIVKTISREAKLATQMDIQDIKSQVSQIMSADGVQSCFDHQKDYISHQFQLVDEAFRASNEETQSKLHVLGSYVEMLLQMQVVNNQASGRISNGDIRLMQGLPSNNELELLSESFGTTKPASRTVGREELEVESRQIEKYISDKKNLSSDGNIPNVQVPAEIAVRVQTWITAADSQALWIKGLTHPTHGRVVSTTAAYVVALAYSTRIPCISFFCQLQGLSGQTQHEQLISLLYSLIRQLSLLVPETIDLSSDLLSDLRSLNGNLASIPLALKIIEILYDSAPPLLFCVLNGLQFLGKGADASIGHLIDILRKPHEGRVTKLLVTTRGLIPPCSRFGPRERLDCARLPTKGPGRSLLTNRSLSSISLPWKRDE